MHKLTNMWNLGELLIIEVARKKMKEKHTCCVDLCEFDLYASTEALLIQV